MVCEKSKKVESDIFQNTSSGRETSCFTAKELDDETGLYYYGARYLNPRTSRWISSDPAGFELINPAQRGFSISGLNWYAYTSNNPVMYTDPTGMEEEIQTLEMKIDISKDPGPVITHPIYDSQDSQLVMLAGASERRQQEYLDGLTSDFEAWEARNSKRNFGEQIIAGMTDPMPPAMRGPDGEVLPVLGGTLPFISGPAGGSGVIKTGGKLARWLRNFGMKAGRHGKQLYNPLNGQYSTLAKLKLAFGNSKTGSFLAGVGHGYLSDSAPGIQTSSFRSGVFIGQVAKTVKEFF